MTIVASESVLYQPGNTLFETLIGEVGQVFSDAPFLAGLVYESIFTFIAFT